MTKKQKQLLIRIIVAAVFFVPLYLLSEGIIPNELPKWAILVLFLIPYLTAGHDVIRKALIGIKDRRPFDECFLMTVATVGAIVLGEYGVDMVNVHAAGGFEMMKAAKEGLMLGAARYADKPKLIAVTQRTSTDEETMHNELLIDRPLPEVVRQYALNAKAAGLDGVVCSAMEAADIHMACGSGFLTVTPGIRLAGDSVGDQKRVMTPADARDQGSDYIVVGRSITGEEKPIAAYQKCREDFIG